MDHGIGATAKPNAAKPHSPPPEANDPLASSGAGDGGDTDVATNLTGADGPAETLDSTPVLAGGLLGRKARPDAGSGMISEGPTVMRRRDNHDHDHAGGGLNVSELCCPFPAADPRDCL